MNYTRHTLSCMLWVVILSGLFSIAHATSSEVRIGLRAYQGTDLALKHWKPTADYLTSTIAGYNFKFIPYDNLDAIMKAASKNQFDFIFTNPSSYVEMNLSYKAKSLVTLINKRNNTAQTRFGSVIFTHAENTDITELKNLKHRTLMAVSESAFSGWRVGWLELKQQRIDPYDDFARLSWGNGNQHNVVYAVRDKKVDAGVVRTDMLERMAASKLIDLRTFRILDAKETEGFPFFHSTALYPEWPFAVMPRVPAELLEKVKQALLNISKDHPASQAGQYIGWTDSLSYEPVRLLMQELSVGPYKSAKQAKTTSGKWVLLGLFLLLTAYLVRKNIKPSNCNFT